MDSKIKSAARLSQLTLRVFLCLCLGIQTLMVLFYFVGIGALALMHTITFSFDYLNTFPWMLYGAMGLFIAANIHLLARLSNKSPEKYRKQWLDIFATTTCVSFPGWANFSMMLRGHWVLEDHLFYGPFTLFNIFMLCLVSFPRSQEYLFNSRENLKDVV